MRGLPRQEQRRLVSGLGHVGQQMWRWTCVSWLRHMCAAEWAQISARDRLICEVVGLST